MTLSADHAIGRAPTADDAMLLLAILNGPAGEQASAGIEVLWTYSEPPSFEDVVREASCFIPHKRAHSD